MRQVHVLVSVRLEDEREYAAAVADIADVYRFESNIEAFERLTSAQAPVDLLVLTPWQDNSPFNEPAADLARRLTGTPLGQTSNLAGLRVAIVDPEARAFEDQRTVRVPALADVAAWVVSGQVPVVEPAGVDIATSSPVEGPSCGSFDTELSLSPQMPDGEDLHSVFEPDVIPGGGVESLIEMLWNDDAAPQPAAPQRRAHTPVVSGGGAAQAAPARRKAPKAHVRARRSGPAQTGRSHRKASAVRAAMQIASSSDTPDRLFVSDAPVSAAHVNAAAVPLQVHAGMAPVAAPAPHAAGYPVPYAAPHPAVVHAGYPVAAPHGYPVAAPHGYPGAAAHPGWAAAPGMYHGGYAAPSRGFLSSTSGPTYAPIEREVVEAPPLEPAAPVSVGQPAYRGGGTRTLRPSAMHSPARSAGQLGATSTDTATANAADPVLSWHSSTSGYSASAHQPQSPQAQEAPAAQVQVPVAATPVPAPMPASTQSWPHADVQNGYVTPAGHHTAVQSGPADDEPFGGADRILALQDERDGVQFG